MQVSYKFFFIAATLILGVAACGEKPVPDDTPTGIGSQSVAELVESNIAGTAIAANSTVAGQIRNAATGIGIQGVPVSDGYNFTTTDENGVYQMVRNQNARSIYYTTPSEYKVSLEAKQYTPSFYSEGTLSAGKKYRIDFELEPLDKVEDKFTLIMIGDPQCGSVTEANRYVKETVADIKAFAGQASRFPNPYAVTLGDITFDSKNMFSIMKATMAKCAVSGGYIPFFQCIGNHDHDSTQPDTSDNEVDDYVATSTYESFFGPTDYSFNRGKAHIVVMDDIIVSSTASSSKPNGKTWNYSGGITDEQLEWLRQDLNLVEDKADKLIILCMHIPIRSTTSGNFSNIKSLLKQFGEAHIMIGHTHYPQNYIHTADKAVNGQPIYEHIHQAACGAWWSCNSSVTGAPNGYNVYTVEGNRITDWVNKGTNREEDYQMRVYDGNQMYSGSKGYTYYWYKTDNTYQGIKAVGNASLQNAFVAEVWDDDDSNWQVEMWQNGTKLGNFTRLANGKSCNIAITAYYFNELGKKTDTWVNKTASHYWYFVPSSKNPSAEKDWEVRAIQRIPSSGKEKTYSVNRLTTDYSEF